MATASHTDTNTQLFLAPVELRAHMSPPRCAVRQRCGVKEGRRMEDGGWREGGREERRMEEEREGGAGITSEHTAPSNLSGPQVRAARSSGSASSSSTHQFYDSERHSSPSAVALV